MIFKTQSLKKETRRPKQGPPYTVKLLVTTWWLLFIPVFHSRTITDTNF